MSNDAIVGDNTTVDLSSDPFQNLTNSTTIDEYQIFVSTEFFYNLLPCYIFIIAGLYRLLTIYKQPSFRDKIQTLQQQETPGFNQTTEGDRESQPKIIMTTYQNGLDLLEELTASYYIKTRLSFANCFLYIISAIFSFVMPASMFAAAVNPVEGLFYLFGVVAWFLSAKLLKVEFEKGLNQEIYTHRLFWVFAGSLALIRIFQRSEVIAFFLVIIIKLFNEKKPLFNVIINITRFLLIFFLMIYAIFKPYDREVEMGVVEDEMPTWAKAFFEKFESNRLISKMVGYHPEIEDQNQREMSPALNPEELAETSEKFRRLIQERRNSNVVQNVNQEQFLLKNLPKRRVVGLSKLPIKKRINNNETKVYYQIITQIDQNRCQTEKKYPEFLSLEKELTEIYNPQDFPNLYDKLPILEKVNLNELTDEQQLVSKRIEFLEKFLQAIFRSPAFIHPKVLAFLEIAEEDKSPFIAYFSYISKGIYKARRSFSKAINDIQSEGNKPQTRRKSSKIEPVGDFDVNRLEKAYKKNFIFEISCVDWQKGAFGNHYEYVFSITDQTKFPFQTWRLSKTLSVIRDFHHSLENRTGRSIPFFTRYMPPNITNDKNDKNSLNTRKEGLNKYIKEIASNKVYYCDVFFEFIEFDPIREVPFSVLGSGSRKNSGFEEVGTPNLDEEFYFTFEDKPEEIRFPKMHEMKSKGTYNKDPKVVCGIDFNYVVIKVVGVKSSARDGNELAPSEKTESIVHYFLNLEEYYDTSNNSSEPRLRTVVKVKKRYDDFSALSKNVWSIYRDISDIIIPALPAQKLVVHGVTKFDPKERKQTWEEYFFNLLRIPKIEENESFKEFFKLGKLEKGPNHYRNEKEIHDFT